MHKIIELFHGVRLERDRGEERLGSEPPVFMIKTSQLNSGGAERAMTAMTAISAN